MYLGQNGELVFKSTFPSKPLFFWGDKNNKLLENSKNTITELCYIPNTVKDGTYILNIQIPNFTLDAAPSRPILIPFRSKCAMLVKELCGKLNVIYVLGLNEIRTWTLQEFVK